jgi:hypothetical protein
MESNREANQWRLYALECARRFEYLLRDPHDTMGAEVLSVTERHISGEATDEELSEARSDAEESALAVTRYMEDEVRSESMDRIVRTVEERSKNLGEDRARAYAIAWEDAKMAELSSLRAAIHTISLAARFNPNDAESLAKEVENSAAQVFAEIAVQEVAYRTAYMAERRNPPMHTASSADHHLAYFVNRALEQSGIEDSDGLAPLNTEAWQRTLDTIRSQAAEIELSRMRKEMNRPESAEDPTAGFVAHLDEEHGNVSSADRNGMTQDIA